MASAERVAAGCGGEAFAYTSAMLGCSASQHRARRRAIAREALEGRLAAAYARIGTLEKQLAFAVRECGSIPRCSLPRQGKCGCRTHQGAMRRGAPVFVPVTPLAGAEQAEVVLEYLRPLTVGAKRGANLVEEGRDTGDVVDDRSWLDAHVDETRDEGPNVRVEEALCKGMEMSAGDEAATVAESGDHGRVSGTGPLCECVDEVQHDVAMADDTTAAEVKPASHGGDGDDEEEGHWFFRGATGVYGKDYGIVGAATACHKGTAATLRDVSTPGAEVVYYSAGDDDNDGGSASGEPELPACTPVGGGCAVAMRPASKKDCAMQDDGLVLDRAVREAQDEEKELVRKILGLGAFTCPRRHVMKVCASDGMSPCNGCHVVTHGRIVRCECVTFCLACRLSFEDEDESKGKGKGKRCKQNKARGRT